MWWESTGVGVGESGDGVTSERRVTRSATGAGESCLGFGRWLSFFVALVRFSMHLIVDLAFAGAALL